MLAAVGLFIVGLICLIKGGDWFVEGAMGIAHRFKMPEILIGATVVSIGTTLPEVMVSATAAVSGHSQIAYGNAIGSIICNTALILAITAAFSPQKVERKGIIMPVAFFFAAAGFYVAIAYIRGYFSRLTGILLLVLFVVYMVTLTRSALKSSGAAKASETSESSMESKASETSESSMESKASETSESSMELKGDVATLNLSAAETDETTLNLSLAETDVETLNLSAAEADETTLNLSAAETDETTSETSTDNNEETGTKERSLFMEVVLLVVGAVLIAVGADLLVDNGTLIAAALGVPESVIALTFVALGTSLPELVTAITSLLKGHGALSLGNVIGANLFNLVLVSGTASALCPFEVPAEKMIAGINSSLIIDVPLMVVVMLLATIPTIAKGRIARWQGVLLLLIYAAFIASQFII